MNAANDNSKNALLVAQQYVRSYACKVEVLGLSLNKLEEAKKKKECTLLCLAHAKIEQKPFCNPQNENDRPLWFK